jgi:hypothetical protein
MRYYRMANKDYLEWAQGFGFNPNANPITFNLYSEVMQKFRLAARGKATWCRRRSTAAGWRRSSIRCRCGMRHLRKR